MESNSLWHFSDKFIDNREILDGHLLGDGCLNWGKEGNPRLLICQSKEQKDFVEYLHQKLCPLANILDTKNSYTIRCSSSKLISYYQRWYPQNTKKQIIPRDFKITPTAMLMAFIGDGSTYRNPKKPNQVELSLATNCFVLEDTLWLSEKIQLEIGIKMGIHKHPSGCSLRTKKKDNVKKFLEYIGPCPILSMQYKWKYPIFTRDPR